jgi:hypothetical protein
VNCSHGLAVELLVIRSYAYSIASGLPLSKTRPNCIPFIKVFAGNIFDLGAAASIARFERGSGSGSFTATVAELEGESYECYMSNGFCHHGFNDI